jgi:hypothetical protein
MAMKDALASKYRRVQCSRMKEAGTCDNRRAYAVEPIERRVIENLQQHLRDPRAIERFVLTYHAERKRLAGAESGRRSGMEKRLGEVTRELDRSVTSLVKGLVPPEAIGPRITQLTAERKALESDLQAKSEDKIVALHPTALKHYLSAVDELAAQLIGRAADSSQESPKALRELVDSVVIHMRPGEPDIEIRGRLAALAGTTIFPQAKIVGLSLVAEERYTAKPQPLFSLWAA